MADLFNTIRSNLKSIADSVPGLQNNMLGNTEFAAGTDFFGNIITKGPSLIIENTSGDAEGLGYNGDFDVDANLYFGVTANTNYDFTVADHFVALLINAWVGFSSFVLGGVQASFRVAWSKPSARTDLSPNVFMTPIKLHFRFVPDQQLVSFGFIRTNNQYASTNGKFFYSGS